MAKGQQKSNREKKKPKADKSKTKNEPVVSPFAAAKSKGKPVLGSGGKKT